MKKSAISFCNILNLVFFLVCAFGSIFSTLEIVQIFFGGETTVNFVINKDYAAKDTGSRGNLYHMPTFVLCADDPYKDNTKVLLSLEELVHIFRAYESVYLYLLYA